MAISEDAVRWLYRCFLDREPESEEIVRVQMDTHDDMAAARLFFMQSEEFRNSYRLKTRYLVEEPVPGPVRRSSTLALASIVKNEAARIERMLRSCLPVVDYVVLLDTGSTDATLQIARSVMGSSSVRHTIIDIEFVDFSQARNAALDAVPRNIEWTLMLDADEHLVPEDFQKLADLLLVPDPVIALPRYNFNDPDKIVEAAPYPDLQRRLLRTNSGLRFQGRVHEQLGGNFKTYVAPINTSALGGSTGGPHIHHFGQVQTAERFWQKHNFYTRLAEAADR